MLSHWQTKLNLASRRTAFFLLGDLIEYGTTNDLFTNPKDSRTEAFISGRFG